MDILEEYFNKHVYIEMCMSPVNQLTESLRYLWEAHGVMNNMEDYCAAVTDKIREWLDNRAESETKTSIQMTADDFNFETFFDACEITLNLEYNTTKHSSSGGYQSGKSGWFDNNMYKIYMRINTVGNEQELINQARVSTAHELTHAYDDYSRRAIGKDKKGVPDMWTVSMRSGQFVADDDSNRGNDDTLFSEVSEMIYFFAKNETNAYIGQARSEIRNYFQQNPPRATYDITKAIASTRAYRELQDKNNKMDILHKFATYPDEIGKNAKDKVLYTFNRTRMHNSIVRSLANVEKDTPVTTYNQVLKIMDKKFHRFEKQIKTQLPKIAYDVYMEFMDPGTDKGKQISETIARNQLMEEANRMREIINKMK